MTAHARWLTVLITVCVRLGAPEIYNLYVTRGTPLVNFAFLLLLEKYSRATFC